MSELRRFKKLGTLRAVVKYEELKEPTILYTFIDGEVVKGIPESVIEQSLKEDLDKVSLKEGTHIKKLHTSFSYSTEDIIKDFNFGNVIVEIFLPYCLHLPNNSELLINIPENDLRALAIHEKIWTNRARTKKENSDNVDIFAENICLYFKKSVILSPTLPYQEELGWDSYVTGTNIEKDQDQNGTFRFSKILLQLSVDAPADVDKVSYKEIEKYFTDISNKSLLLINRLIDNYREITGEIYIRRLGKLKINIIYFPLQDKGYYITDLNVKTAMMNRTNKEFKDLLKRLKYGNKPELYKLLLHNARSSYSTNDLTLAIVESFQALEIFLENYLISNQKERGDDALAIKRLMEKYWRTKERLNKLLKSIKGKALNDNKEIWNRWCTAYDKTRNEVIHEGREATEQETIKTLDINEQVIAWILKL